MRSVSLSFYLPLAPQISLPSALPPRGATICINQYAARTCWQAPLWRFAPWYRYTEEPHVIFSMNRRDLILVYSTVQAAGEGVSAVQQIQF